MQLLGFRGAPGNTINHTTSYWVPNHTPKVFVEQVDVVCGVGYDRAAELGPVASPLPRDPPGRHQPRRVRLRDPRPPHAAALGAPRRTVDEVVEATGFELAIPDEVAESPAADRRGAALLHEVIDPEGRRLAEDALDGAGQA